MARILLIDDDPTTRKLIDGVLSLHDHEVTEAPCGLDGLVLCKKHPYDIAIVDLFMPKINGIQVIEKMRQYWPGMKIVAISGGGPHRHEPEAFLTFARKAGADWVLRKPIHKADLLACIGELAGNDSQANAQNAGPGTVSGPEPDPHDGA
ncbi:MAG: response regulator [Candidatus Hydrogenedentes bacterium]|nr:response regulator [Candidatus Hydrogenedentota bacterium]